MRNILKSKLAKAALLASSLVAAGSASAALPTEATAAFTAIEADGGSLISAGWPLVVTITGGLILIKLFKKVIGKVT